MPVRNGSATVVACLDALAAQRGAPPFEVIVVDNGSTDETVNAVAAHPLAVHLETEHVTGSYAARNRGAREARGAILAFTDADCVPEPAWIAEGAAVLAHGADLAGGPIIPLASDAPTIWERYDTAAYLDQQHHVEIDGFAATANLLVRRSVFDAVGGFDQSLRSSGDVDFCRRSRAAGYTLAYAPAARVRHEPRTTLRETWKLHRRLGAGWTALERRGAWPRIPDDRALRPALGTIVAAARQSGGGGSLRRRHLFAAHALVVLARWTGRLTGRG